MINIHPTRVEKDVLFNNKQFVLLNGDRGYGGLYERRNKKTYYLGKRAF